MHANTAAYWNRKELYPALGFGAYYDRSFFGTDHSIGMGASDRQLVKKALPFVVSKALDGPVYCQLVTLSPHHPFTLPRSAVQLETPELLRGTTLGHYLEAMNYEDRQIGWFVDQLKAYGLWDKSVVVIYGDHAGLRPSDLKKEDNLERLQVLLGRPYTTADRANIPIVIHLPKDERGVRCYTSAGQVDIMPTIADAIGLDLSNTPHFGRSLFTNTRPLLAGRSGLPLRVVRQRPSRLRSREDAPFEHDPAPGQARWFGRSP